MQSKLLRAFCFIVWVGLHSQLAGAQDKNDSVADQKLLLAGETFQIEGRPAFVFWPHGKALESRDKLQAPIPWVMYSPTLPGIPDIHEKWMHGQFTNAGVAVAGIDMGETYGSPQGQELMSALYAELTTKRGFATKPCLLGRSRGGLWASSWAIRHPERVSGLAGIYPVFDLTTYPGIQKAASAYGLEVDKMQAELENHNPISKIEVLAKVNVPFCMIHGDQDKVVPIEKNSLAVLEQYQASGADKVVQLIVAEGQGHNYWQGFFRCQELVNFVIKQAKLGAAADDTRQN